MSNRHRWTCPRCGKLLAYSRPQLIVLRRLVFTDHAAGHDNQGGTVIVRCMCGATITITWTAIQF